MDVMLSSVTRVFSHVLWSLILSAQEPMSYMNAPGKSQVENWTESPIWILVSALLLLQFLGCATLAKSLHPLEPQFSYL